jgi:arylsulfatase A-like enzyme
MASCLYPGNTQVKRVVSSFKHDEETMAMNWSDRQDGVSARTRGAMMASAGRRLLSGLLAGLAVAGWAQGVAAVSGALDRTVLPLQEPVPPTYTELDVRKATPPPRFQVQAPEGAPNVILVLIDDLGFGGTSAFGGPISTPTIEAIALQQLPHHGRLLADPRTALKSGRNHHVNNMGSIIETGTPFPGNTGQIPNEIAPLAEMLRLNGYSTAAFGKWHETAAWEASVAGPFDRWPTRQGFDKFYGFLGGETNHWAPFIYDGVHQVELPEDPNYHFLTDMTDQSVAWVRHAEGPDPGPAVLHLLRARCHPCAAPRSAGVDRPLEGQIRPGLGRAARGDPGTADQARHRPSGTKLAPKPEAIPDWDTLSADQKRLFTRQFEVFAAFLE